MIRELIRDIIQGDDVNRCKHCGSTDHLVKEDLCWGCAA